MRFMNNIHQLCNPTTTDKFLGKFVLLASVINGPSHEKNGWAHPNILLHREQYQPECRMISSTELFCNISAFTGRGIDESEKEV